MILVSPPVSKPYVFGTKQIAGVRVGLTPRPTGVAVFWFQLLDVDGNTLPYDSGAVSGPSPTQVATMCAAAAQAGDTFEKDQSRRALAWVQTGPLGLSGAAVQ